MIAIATSGYYAGSSVGIATDGFWPSAGDLIVIIPATFLVSLGRSSSNRSAVLSASASNQSSALARTGANRSVTLGRTSTGYEP